MQFLTVTVVGLLYVHFAGQDKVDIIKAFQQVCPYTNFCSYNASQTIKDGRQAPCCRECSCADDCWTRGNCCPDKIINEDEPKSEQETCKSTTVKESIYNVRTTNGLVIYGKRYFVIEACPTTTNDDNLKQKCSGTAMETFTDLIWVSDAKTNKIYKNRFCAECNSVRKYKQWDLSTSCADFMSIQNYSHTVSALPTHCTLTVSPPDRKAEVNRCLTPDISTCNETGLWQTRDSVTESLCENHQLMFIEESLPKVTYRNVFCYKCNAPPGASVQDSCENVYEGAKSWPISFTAIFNIFEEEDKPQTEKQCQVEEVKDALKESCLKLLCPELQFARYGSCQKIFSKIYFLGITITYSLRPNWDKLKYGTKNPGEYSITGFVKAIRRQMYHNLDLGECGSCYGLFSKSNTKEAIGNAQIPRILEFRLVFYTLGRQCDDTKIVDALSEIIDKEMTVYLDETEYVTFDIDEIDQPRDSQGNMSEVILGPYEDDDGFCAARYVLNYRDMKKCPMVKLDNSYNQHLMSLTHMAAQRSRVKSLFDVDDGPDGPTTMMNTTSVCWEDYRKLVLSLTGSSRKSTVDPIFTMITGIVSIIVY